jgi:hypothetical protein
MFALRRALFAPRHAPPALTKSRPAHEALEPFRRAAARPRPIIGFGGRRREMSALSPRHGVGKCRLFYGIRGDGHW